MIQHFRFAIDFAAILVGGLFLLVLVSCSGNQNVSVRAPISAQVQKSVYVIQRTTSTVVGYNVIPMPGTVIMTDGERSERAAIGETAVHIRNALAARGFRAVMGDGRIIPPDINLVVTYHDEWQWDFKMYLKSLKITFYSRHSSAIMAEGSYRSGGEFHDFPSSEREAPRLIDSILTN